MREYEQSINNVLDTLETNRNKGLSEIEVNGFSNITCLLACNAFLVYS